MPRKAAASGQSDSSNVERVRRYLSGGGIIREDSDDELGLEDYPWRWIYEKESQEDALYAGGEVHDHKNAQIVGAKMGNFECRLGDCVLLKAQGTNEAWIGIICEFQHDDDEEVKSANFMWFSTEKEIRNKQKKRMDAVQVRTVFTGSRSCAYFLCRTKSILRLRGI